MPAPFILVPYVAAGLGTALVVWGVRMIWRDDDSSDAITKEILSHVPEKLRDFLKIEKQEKGVAISISDEAPDDARTVLEEKIGSIRVVRHTFTKCVHVFPGIASGRDNEVCTVTLRSDTSAVGQVVVSRKKKLPADAVTDDDVIVLHVDLSAFELMEPHLLQDERPKKICFDFPDRAWIEVG